jgi:hypothetical protein
MTDGAILLGYAFDVLPSGWVVISPDRQLTAIRAYSTTGSLDPASEQGMAGFVRRKAKMALSGLRLMASGVAAQRAAALTEFPNWRELATSGLSELEKLRSREVLGATYQGGQILLSSAWHQDAPYNAHCPVQPGPPPCTTLVGCVPLGAAQVMRYWCWPPYGSGAPQYTDPYDWTNMPDTLESTSAAAEIAAVANLCREAGAAADVDYGCNDDGTWGHLSCWWAGCRSMEDALHDTFRYSNDFSADRHDDSQEQWFNRLREDLDKRQPLLYRITDHVVVVDGWQILGATWQYHVNYGWSGEQNLGWHTVDKIPGSDDTDDEYALINLRPAASLGPVLAGIFPREASFPFRYIYRNSAGAGVFDAGQNLQFLPGASLTGVSWGTEGMKIRGENALPTRLYSGGDASRGVKIVGGGIILRHNGGVVLSPINPPPFFKATIDQAQRCVVLTWEPSPGLTDVVIERSLAGKILTSQSIAGIDATAAREWSIIATVPQQPGAWRDTTVELSYVYEYRLRGHSERGYSDYSRVLQVWTPKSW